MSKNVFDNSKLRGRIVEKYGTIGDFSSAIGKNRSSISSMLNGKGVMDRRDIKLFMDALGIEHEEIGDYFFAEKVVTS